MTQHVVVYAHKVGDEVSAAHRAGLHYTRRLHANIFKWFKEESAIQKSQNHVLQPEQILTFKAFFSFKAKNIFPSC